MSPVTPGPAIAAFTRPLDTTLAGRTHLGRIDAKLAMFLPATVRGRGNVIVTGGVNVGKTTVLRLVAILLRALSRMPFGEEALTHPSAAVLPRP